MSDIPTKTGIYAILNETTGKIYIGSAINLKRRKDRHFSDLVGGCHHNQYLQRAFSKYDSSVFSFHVIEIVEDLELLIPREQFYMDETRSYEERNGYNLSPTAGSNLGIHPSQETRQKLSVALQGRKLSDEHRRKISATLSGRKLSKERCRKISEGLLGKKRSLFSDEHCLNISKAQKYRWKQYYVERDKLQLTFLL